MSRERPEVHPEHAGCVCCDLPIERGVPVECNCPNAPSHKGSG